MDRLADRASRIDQDHLNLKSSLFRPKKEEEDLSSGESDIDDAFLETDMGKAKTSSYSSHVL